MFLTSAYLVYTGIYCLCCTVFILSSAANVSGGGGATGCWTWASFSWGSSVILMSGPALQLLWRLAHQPGGYRRPYLCCPSNSDHVQKSFEFAELVGDTSDFPLPSRRGVFHKQNCYLHPSTGQIVHTRWGMEETISSPPTLPSPPARTGYILLRWW